MAEIHIHDLWWETVLRLILALAFGAAVGWDREADGHPAGLRTHMLVALGAAGLACLAADLIQAAADTPDAAPHMDPLRIIQGIVGGVGFLGAGAIIQSRGEIKGLTTAAGLWVVAALGIAAGLGYYVLAGFMTALAVIVLSLLKRLKQAV